MRRAVFRVWGLLEAGGLYNFLQLRLGAYLRRERGGGIRGWA